MIDALPAILRSVESGSNIESFRELALPRLGPLFDADLVNFFRCTNAPSGVIEYAGLHVLGHGWTTAAQQMYQRQIRRRDPIVALMRKGVHEGHYNTIKLSAFRYAEYNEVFPAFLSLMDSQNLITIVLSAEGRIWASISVGRSAAKGDFSDREMSLAQVIATSFNISFISMLNRQRMRAHALAINEMRRANLDALLAIAAKNDMAYWNADVAARLQIEEGDVLANIPILSPCGGSAPCSTVLRRDGKSGVVLTGTADRSSSPDFVVIRCRPLLSGAPELADPLSIPTQREREIIGLICQGMTAQKIACTLGISVWTVKNHLKNIYAKQGVTSRVELAQRFPTIG